MRETGPFRKITNELIKTNILLELKKGRYPLVRGPFAVLK